MSRFHKLFGLGLAWLMLVGLLPLVFASQPAIAAGDATVQVSKDAKLGDILTDSKGMTLYLFTKDQENVSNCSGGCATAWPPLVVAAGQAPTAGEGVTGKLGVITRQGASAVAPIPLATKIAASAPSSRASRSASRSWLGLFPYRV